MPYLFSPKTKNVVIAHPSRKGFYLRKKVENPYLDLEVMTLQEMKALFDYNYDDRALRFLLGKGYSYLVAKDLLKAFAAPHFEKGVEVKKYASLRDELIKEHLLFKVAYPERTFIGSHILISGYYREASIISEYLGSLSGKMEIDFEFEDYKDPSTNVVNRFIDPYEELHFLYNKIAYDIDVNKTPLKDIYVYGLTSDYVPLINEFNKMYGITIGIKIQERLYDMGIYKTFRETYLEKGLEEAVSLMREKYPDSKDADTIEKFAREFAVVFENSPAKTISIYDDIAKEKEPHDDKFKNLIQVLSEPVCPLEGHLYCVNFAMGQYPTVKDESGFFSDKEKKLIGLDTSKDISLGESERVDKLLHNANLKLITFFELGFEEHHFLSGFAEKYAMKVVNSPVAEDENGPYEYAHDKGAFLFAALEDEYENYLQDDKRRAAYKEASDLKSYRTYKPSFKGSKTMRDKKRKYSASSLSNYRSCPFRYLMSNIVLADDSPSNFASRIGNIFHKTLEMYHKKEDFDFDKAYSEAMDIEQGIIKDPSDIDESKEPFTPKEKAIVENLRAYCKKSLEFQKKYEANLKDPNFMAEGWFNIDLGGPRVTGRYDKVVSFGPADNRRCFIIDYKTGSTSFDEALFRNEHGLSLQLPLYAFALENDKAAFDNAKIGGLFISPILPYNLKNEKGQSMDAADQKELRLKGVFLNDPDFLRLVEPGLDGTSELFDGCKLDKNGCLTSQAEYPRFKSDEEFREIAERAKQIVLESDDSIMKGNFEIKPTVIKGKIDACEYCPFHDVCFVDKKKIAAEILRKSSTDPEEDDGVEGDAHAS